MNTREIATEYRLSHWAVIMRERQESGLSIKAFCEATGFHQNVYYYWQRKLRESACQHLLSTTQEKSETAIAPSGLVGDSVSCSPVPPGWAVCSIDDGESKEQTVTIEIGKCRINAAADTDSELLSKVCRVLMSLC